MSLEMNQHTLWHALVVLITVIDTFRLQLQLTSSLESMTGKGESNMRWSSCYLRRIVVWTSS